MAKFELTPQEEDTLRVLQRAEESAVASGKLPSAKSEDYKKLTEPQRVRAIVESFRSQMGVPEKDFPIVEGPLTKSEGLGSQGKLQYTSDPESKTRGNIFTSGTVSYPESVETSLHELLHAREVMEGGYKNKPAESHFMRSKKGESDTQTLIRYMDELRKEVERKRAIKDEVAP